MCILNQHGPQSSLTLHESTIEDAHDYDGTKAALYNLWKGGMVYRPIQQTFTQNSNYNYLVYDLTDKGKKYLKDNNLWVEAIRPTGPWVHQFMVSTITATMDIMCLRNGYTYIPGHEIVKTTLHCDVEFDWDGKPYTKRLTPDAIFAINYGGSYIAYIIEADRNTEANDPKTPHRKSSRRNIKQYKNFQKHYKVHYGLNCPLVVLTVTTSKNHIPNVLKMIDEEIGPCPYLAFGLAEEFGNVWHPPKRLLSHLFEEGLKRNGKEDWIIKKDTQ